MYLYSSRTSLILIIAFFLIACRVEEIGFQHLPGPFTQTALTTALTYTRYNPPVVFRSLFFITYDTVLYAYIVYTL